jgi:hypothetical protein
MFVGYQTYVPIILVVTQTWNNSSLRPKAFCLLYMFMWRLFIIACMLIRLQTHYRAHLRHNCLPGSIGLHVYVTTVHKFMHVDRTTTTGLLRPGASGKPLSITVSPRNSEYRQHVHATMSECMMPRYMYCSLSRNSEERHACMLPTIIDPVALG